MILINYFICLFAGVAVGLIGVGIYETYFNKEKKP